LDVVQAWLAGDEGRRADIEEWSREIRDKHSPFHWHLEFPEVFFLERPDPLDDDKVNGAAFMDAFVGNPPFAGKNGVVALGDCYLDWLQTVQEHSHGNADLSAHFFRRTAVLIGAHGSLGLVATNTIAQGDTRATGLQYLVSHAGFTIFDATRSMPWPGDAAVDVSVVLLAKGHASEGVRQSILDELPSPAISSRLRPTPERSDPVVLEANRGYSFQGSIVLGLGFTLTSGERDALITKHNENGERIFPYLGGQEVNTSPTQAHDRYVISFGQMSLTEAERWPDLLAIVREKVKPERDQNNRENYRKCWWQFAEYRPGLFEAIANLNRCFVTSGISKHRVFAAVTPQQVFTHNLYVFPLQSMTSFAVLQSKVHIPWADLLSSGLETRGGYRPSDCFETFPFPQPDPRAVIPAVEAAGERLYAARAAYMVDTNQGLTQTYNHLKDRQHDDPRILELRALHEAMDRAVLDAYGWTDLAVPPFCPLTPDDTRALDAFQDTIIDRLFVLNAERAAEERRLGLGKPTAKRSKPKRAWNAKTRGDERQTTLIDPDKPGDPR